MKYRLSLLSLALLVTSCSLDSSDVVSPEDNSVTIAVSTSSNSSRVAVDDENSSAGVWNFVWEDGDAISVWYDGMGTFNKFNMIEHDVELSTFSGTVDGDQSIRLIYPADESADCISEGVYRVDISAQDGALNKTYMMSSGLIDVVDGEVESTPNVSHFGGFMAIYLKLENTKEYYDYEITSLKMSGVPTYMDIELATADFMSNDSFYDSIEDQSGTVTATLSGLTFESGSEEVRLNMLPFTYDVGDQLTFDITYTINGKEGALQVVNTNSTSVAFPFDRARYNYTTITLDGSSDVIVATGCTIQDWDPEDKGDLSEFVSGRYSAEVTAEEFVLFTVESMPLTDDDWVVTGTEVDEAKFKTMIAEVGAELNSSGRTITLTFPDVTDLGFLVADNPTFDGNDVPCYLQEYDPSYEAINYWFRNYVTADDAYLYNNSYITKFSAPKVTSVPVGCFAEWSALSSVEFSADLSEVGDVAFYGCKKLTSFDYDKISKIGAGAFYNNQAGDALMTLNLSELTELSECAFICCKWLGGVENYNLTTVPQYAFAGTGITSFDFTNITSIGKCSFMENLSLTTITNYDGLDEIPFGAFYFNKVLTSFDFDNITSIGEYSFASCQKLAELGNFKITVLPKYAFSGCYLTTFDFENITSIDDGVFYICMKLSTIDNFKFTEIPDNFFRGTAITSFDCSGVTSIGSNALSYCGNLTSLTNISATTIGELALQGNTIIESYTLQEGVESIGNSVFVSCSKLTSVELPSTVTSLGTQLFVDSNQDEMTLTLNWSNSNEILEYNSEWFKDFSGTVHNPPTIYIPANTTSLYEAKGWSELNLVESTN